MSLCPGLAESIVQMEKLLLAMGGPVEHNIAVFTQQRGPPRRRGYSAESEARRLRPASAWRDDILRPAPRRPVRRAAPRVELARILFAGSDVLAARRTTNHLDVDAKAWMLDFLRAYRAPLVVISHDLDLLDEPSPV